MNLTHIDHAGLNVSDGQRSADWYRRVFGFELIHKFTHTWMVGRGLMRLGLAEVPGAQPVGDLDHKIAITHLAFQTDAAGFEAAQKELKGLGVPFDPPEDTGIAYSIFFTGPDGNLLEITTYHDEKG
jgi:catechol 2,3-dioxygenase-like lactoylglutathione lyase family enzyme